jgi:ribosomal protein L37AE/L43A
VFEVLRRKKRDVEDDVKKSFICFECGGDVIVKESGKLIKKKILECSNCGKTWNGFEEYYLSREMKEVEEKIKEIYETGNLERLAEELRLLEVDVPLILKKNEVPYLVEESNLLEMVRESYKFRGQSIGVSFRVARGVYLRPRIGTGTLRGSEEKLRLTDSGILVLTNRRLVFLGNKKTTTIQLNKIINAEANEDKLVIAREGKQKVEMFQLRYPELWEAAIVTAVQNLQE